MTKQINLSINRKKYLHVLIMIIITFGIGYLPTFGAITPLGMKVLGVFLGLVYGWVFIDLLWVSLYGFFALALTGYASLLDVFTSAFSNSTVITVLIVCAFSEYLNALGVNQAIAYWVMGRKIFLGRPWLLIIGLLLTGMLIGTVGGNFAGLFLLWGVIRIIGEENKIEKSNIFLSLAIAVTFYAVMISGAHVPFQAAFLLFSGFFTQATNLTIPNGQFLLLGELYTFISIAIVIFISKVFFKLDSSKFILTEEMQDKYRVYKISWSQKLALILLVVYFLGLIAPSLLPKDSQLYSILSSWGIVGFSILYMIFFTIINDRKGKALVDMNKAFKDGVLWPTVILLAVTLPLGDAMVSENTGVSATIANFCSQHLGEMNIYVLQIIAVFMIGLLTQFMHNIVLGMIFVPILVPLSITLGGNPYTMFFVLHCAFVCAYATPAGCMQASVLFGSKDIPAKHSYIFGWMLYVTSCITAIVLVPLANAILPY